MSQVLSVDLTRLPHRRFRFATLMAQGTCPSKAEAYRQAFDSKASPEALAVGASRLLADPDIVKAIEDLRNLYAQTAHVNDAWVLREWLDVATADPSELTRVIRYACRHCHGFDHEYQWRTEDEFAKALCEAVERGKQAPEMRGGVGYSKRLKPHPECPQCDGLGDWEVFVADTLDVSPQARKLFAGVKQTKNGIEVMMRSQDVARDNIAKSLGMLVQKMQVAGVVGAMPAADMAELTDAQRTALNAALDAVLK
jgi:phage terminase small subunit